MTNQLQTISPIDGTVIVRRAFASAEQAHATLERARMAQALWRAVPIAQRAIVVSKGVDAFVARKAEIAEELTRQMGRPLRYTPGEVGGFEARARHMIGIAGEA
jgi:acyl-CoA reductase-like NAD-dependent aldehyde dehydrogenase